MAEILTFGPQRTIVINGWSVPLLAAHELDGGKVSLVLDGRIGWTIPAGDFDRTVEFLADLIGTCWGYGAHPRDDSFDRATFARVPHPSLAPQRFQEVSGVRGDELG